jgi:cytoskeletal protein CcmA (bactofilin family)
LFGKSKKPPAVNSAPTYVGRGMRIEGKIWGMRPIWIDGEVQGTIDSVSEIIIGEFAKVDAIIRAASIKINGFVEGELFASNRIEIMSKGRVHGNITNLAGSLVIHDGGIFEGKCLTATEEKMKKLLPEQLPKLLQEESSDSVKKLDAPESIEDSNKVKAVNRTEEAKV